MARKYQAGFSVVAAMLVIVVLAVLSYAGWAVYNKGHTPDTSKAAETSQNQVAPNATLTIKEWGVALPLSADIEGAYYANLKIDTFKYPTYGIGIHALTALDAKCGPDNVGAGVISRQTIAEHDMNVAKKDFINDPVFTKKVGEYYYGFDLSRAPCSSNQRALDVQKMTIASLQKAFDGLRAASDTKSTGVD